MQPLFIFCCPYRQYLSPDVTIHSEKEHLEELKLSNDLIYYKRQATKV